MFQRVREFHRLFGLPIAEVPRLPEKPVRDLRIKLLQEELNEFCSACDDDNHIEMADGLADMAVIIAGTMVAYGIAPEGRFDSPYPDGMKPLLDASLRPDYTVILAQTVRLYSAAESNDHLDTIRGMLMVLLLDVCGAAMNLGIPLNAVFAEVLRRIP